MGVKPTVGLTSRYGLHIASNSQDTVGILARSVHDAALLLTVIAGKVFWLYQNQFLPLRLARRG